MAATAHTLGLASPALVDHLHALTAAALAAWQARWGLTRLNADLRASAWNDAGRPRTDAPGEWHDAEAGTPASLFWPACAVQRIESKLFPCIQHEVRLGEGTLARGTARQVADDLQGALRACWQVQALRAGDTDGLRWSRWLAPVQVRIDLGKGCCIVAVLSGASLRPRTPAPRGGLDTPDAGSFHALPARAELLVGHAEIALPELAALQAGDVIVLDTRIQDPLPLRLQSGAAVLHACLGRAGGQRAAQLVSQPQTEGST